MSKTLTPNNILQKNKLDAKEISFIKQQLNDTNKLIENSTNINIKNKQNKTPLIIAYEYNRINIIQKIIETDKNIDIKDSICDKIFALACQYNNLEIIEILIKKGININIRNGYNRTPIMVAYMYNNIEVINKLIENSTKITETDLEQINKLISKNNTKFRNTIINSVELLNKCKQYNTSLEEIDNLIKNNANINIKDENGLTPLIYACSYGNIKLVKNLIKNGAKFTREDLEKIKINDNPKSQECKILLDNSLKLLEECYKQPNLDLSIVDNLIHSGVCCININNNQELYGTLLMTASCNGYKDIVNKLIDEGVYKNIKNNLHQTPSIFMRAYNDLNTINKLIEKGRC